MSYIHLRDKSKPMPTLEECMDRFRRVRKPKDDDGIVSKTKEVKNVREKTDGQKAD